MVSLHVICNYFVHSGSHEKLQDRVNAGAPFTVIYMDADSFKQINDTFGHAVGDTLIKAYAERFEKYCAGHFDCAKVGGDEFALILDGIRTIYSQPYGLTGDGRFTLYPPATPRSELSEALLGWVRWAQGDSAQYTEDQLGFYTLCN